MAEIIKDIKISKRKVMMACAISFIMVVFLWVNRLLYAPLFKSSYPVFEIMMTSMTFLLGLSLLKQTRFTKYCGYFVAIPLLPVLLIAILSQTKFFARLTLPMMVLPLVASLIYYLFKLLEFLHLGDSFDQKVIPYLVLTVTMVSFAYFDKLLINFAARMIPDSQMPQIVKIGRLNYLIKRYSLKQLIYL